MFSSFHPVFPVFSVRRINSCFNIESNIDECITSYLVTTVISKKQKRCFYLFFCSCIFRSDYWWSDWSDICFTAGERREQQSSVRFVSPHFVSSTAQKKKKQQPAENDPRSLSNILCRRIGDPETQLHHKLLNFPQKKYKITDRKTGLKSKKWNVETNKFQSQIKMLSRLIKAENKTRAASCCHDNLKDTSSSSSSSLTLKT